MNSPDSIIEFFDIVNADFSGDSLALFQFIICLDDILRTSIDLMKENGLPLRGKKWYTT